MNTKITFAQTKFDSFGKIKTKEYYSENTKANRKYWVALPNDYKESKNIQYPVVYIFDADNSNSSQMTYYLANYLAKVGPEIPPVILVGVFQEDRAKDFSLGSLTKDTISAFQRFLSLELIPHINKNYRTNNHNIAVGHSMGGAFCFLLATKFPNLFKSYICISPAFHNWKKELLESFFVKKLNDEKFILWSKFYVVYSDYGMMERTLNPHTKDFSNYIVSLENKSLNNATYFEFIANVGHNLTPIIGITAGFSYIFRDWKPKIEDLRNMQNGSLSVEKYCQLRTEIMNKVYQYEFQPMAEEITFYYSLAKTKEDKLFITNLANKLYTKYISRKCYHCSSFLSHQCLNSLFTHSQTKWIADLRACVWSQSITAKIIAFKICVRKPK